MTPKLLRGGADGRGGRAGLRTGPKCGQGRATAAEVVFAVVAKRSDGAEDMLREVPAAGYKSRGEGRGCYPAFVPRRRSSVELGMVPGEASCSSLRAAGEGRRCV